MKGPLLEDLKMLPEKLDNADLRIFAFDIETTKASLKFPDSKFDQIMMISYIVAIFLFYLVQGELLK